MKLSCCLCSHSWCVREAKVAGSKGQPELLCSIPRLYRHAASGAFLIMVTTYLTTRSFMEGGLIPAQSIRRAEVYDCGGGMGERAWGSSSYLHVQRWKTKRGQATQSEGPDFSCPFPCQGSTSQMFQNLPKQGLEGDLMIKR